MDGILVDEHGSLVAGTFARVLQYVVWKQSKVRQDKVLKGSSSSSLEWSHNMTLEGFLCVYRTYGQGKELVTLLKECYKAPLKHMVFSTDMKVVTAREAVTDFALAWLRVAPWEIQEDEGLFSAFGNLLKKMRDSNQTLSEEWNRLQMRRMKTIASSKRVESVSARKIPLLECDPSAVAHELTVIEQNIYAMIRCTEMCDKNWNSEEATKAPMMRKLRERFNQTSFWVCTRVLQAPLRAVQLDLIKMFIRIGSALLKLKNFNGAGAIVAGLDNSLLTRLGLYEELPAELLKEWDSLKFIYDIASNGKNYREAYEAASLNSNNAMILPYVPLHLRDTLVIQERESNWTDKYINYSKVKALGTSIWQTLQFVHRPPLLSKHPAVCSVVSELQTLSEEELQQLSDNWKAQGTPNNTNIQ